jgi:hypothetical protein
VHTRRGEIKIVLLVVEREARKRKVLNCIKESHHEVTTALIRVRDVFCEIVDGGAAHEEEMDAVNGNELTMSKALRTCFMRYNKNFSRRKRGEFFCLFLLRFFIVVA